MSEENNMSIEERENIVFCVYQIGYKHKTDSGEGIYGVVERWEPLGTAKGINEDRALFNFKKKFPKYERDENLAVLRHLETFRPIFIGEPITKLSDENQKLYDKSQGETAWLDDGSD